MMQKKLRYNKEGSAMIIVVALMLILMIFCMMLCMLAYSIFSSSLKGQDREQVKMAAVTLSKQLERQITTPKFDVYDKNDSVTENAATSSQKDALAGSKDFLWFYLRYNIWQTNWPYYNADERGHQKKDAYRYFKLKSGDEEVADKYGLDSVSICMYWCTDYDTKDKDGTPLYIRVTCKRNNQSFSVLNHFSLGVSNYDLNALGKTYDNAAGAPETVQTTVNPMKNEILTNEKWVWSLDDRE